MDSVNKLSSKTGSCIAINFAPKEQLFQIPGMKNWLTEVILLVRKNIGRITKEMLEVITKNQLSPEAYAVMSFTSNRGLSTIEPSHGQVRTCSSGVRKMPVKKTSNQNVSNQSNGLKQKKRVKKTVLRQYNNQRTSGPVIAHLTPGPGIYFNAFIHVYSPRAGADNPLGTNVDVNRKPLSLCPFVASFKTISTRFSCFSTCI